MSGDVHVRFCESGEVRLLPATHLVILVDSYRRHDWLLEAVRKRLREELAKLRNFKFVELKGERMDWLVVTSDENSLVREILVKRRRQNPHPR